MRFNPSQGFHQVVIKTNYHIWIPFSVVGSRVREMGANRSNFMDEKVSRYEWLSIGSSFEPNELSVSFLLPQLEEACECRKKRPRVSLAY
jgi:hypothetical protein